MGEQSGHTVAGCHCLKASHKAVAKVSAGTTVKTWPGKDLFSRSLCGWWWTSGPQWLLAGDISSVPCGLFIAQLTKRLLASLRMSKPQSVRALISEWLWPYFWILFIRRELISPAHTRGWGRLTQDMNTKRCGSLWAILEATYLRRLLWHVD